MAFFSASAYVMLMNDGTLTIAPDDEGEGVGVAEGPPETNLKTSRPKTTRIAITSPPAIHAHGPAPGSSPSDMGGGGGTLRVEIGAGPPERA